LLKSDGKKGGFGDGESVVISDRARIKEELARLHTEDLALDVSWLGLLNDFYLPYFLCVIEAYIIYATPSLPELRK
jgi:hypothetical protein